MEPSLNAGATTMVVERYRVNDMPSATPKLTVIVVAHDNETTIEQCLTSVLQQSLQDVEVLCAGWKCADESQAIAYDLATEDERLVMLGFGHDTASEALNEGLAAAKGDYIHFVSAGDYVLVASVAGGWAKCEYEGITGYLPLDSLEYP